MQDITKRDKFIEKSRLVHGDKYDYSKAVYVDQFTKLEIICSEHGIFMQTPDTHRKSGCRQCGIEASKQKLKVTKEEFIERMKAKYGDAYDYSAVNYVDYKTKVTITCLKPSHGEFNKEPEYLLVRGGCPKCSKEKKSLEQRMTTEQFIKKAKIIYGDKYAYDTTIYVDTRTRLDIICGLHGQFRVLPNEFLRTTRKGAGCPGCTHKVT